MKILNRDNFGRRKNFLTLDEAHSVILEEESASTDEQIVEENLEKNSEEIKYCKKFRLELRKFYTYIFGYIFGTAPFGT